MIELLIFATLFGAFAILNVIRLVKGPNSADRALAADNADILVCCAMILFALFSGRGIYLDIAIICALLGVVDTMLVGRYLDKGRWKQDAEDNN